MSDRLPKGFTCKCGRFDRFDPYVYAHWTDELVFTCEKCGRKYNIYAGTAELFYEPEPGPKLPKFPRGD